MQTSGTKREEAHRIASGFFYIKRNIKVPKAFTPAYIFYRVFRPILKIYYWLFKQFHPMTPWTSPASIIIFKKLLTKEMTGVEFGSGKSTAFFAQHLGKLVSIEHHKGWHGKVSVWLGQRNLSNVDYRLLETDEDPELVFPPEAAAFFPKAFEPRRSYVKYVSELLKFDDNSIDFLLIDGRARTECAFIGMHKLKPGGLFVLDNAERPRYAPVHQALASWPKVFTTTGLTDTVLWFKPH